MRRGRHQHVYEVDGAVTGKTVIPILGAAPSDATWVLYRCECSQPGNLVSVSLGGRWTLEQLRGGEAPVVPVPLALLTRTAEGNPDPA